MQWSIRSFLKHVCSTCSGTYTLVVGHRKGKYMSVPDALSRAPYNVEGEDEKPKLSSIKASIDSIILQKLNFENLDDRWYLNLKEKILERPEAYPSFFVKNNKIFKIKQDESNDIMRKLIIPKDYRKTCWSNIP